MHFSKLITAIVVVAATSALASSHYHEESHELASGAHEFEGPEGGMEAGAFDSEMDESFSPVAETSLEASTNRYCFFGRCLRRRSWRRRCPRGFHAVGYKRCGWWRVRALCCRNRRWAQGQLEGEEYGAESSSELGLDELDN